MAEPKEVQMVFTTEKIEEIKNKVDQGYKITRQEKYWAENYIQTKRDGIIFTLSKDEQDEYFKCKLGVDTNEKPFLGISGQILKKRKCIQWFLVIKRICTPWKLNFFFANVCQHRLLTHFCSKYNC